MVLASFTIVTYDRKNMFIVQATVSKKFPTLASPRLYLVIFFQIYATNIYCTSAVVFQTSFSALNRFFVSEGTDFGLDKTKDLAITGKTIILAANLATG